MVSQTTEMDKVGPFVPTAPDLVGKGLPALSAARDSDLICMLAERRGRVCSAT